MIPKIGDFVEFTERAKKEFSTIYDISKKFYKILDISKNSSNNPTIKINDNDLNNYTRREDYWDFVWFKPATHEIRKRKMKNIIDYEK